MIVSELIEKLSELDPNALVVCDDLTSECYEFEPVCEVEPIKVKANSWRSDCFKAVLLADKDTTTAIYIGAWS